jgi:hypothetical protein
MKTQATPRQDCNWLVKLATKAKSELMDLRTKNIKCFEQKTLIRISVNKMTLEQACAALKIERKAV